LVFFVEGDDLNLTCQTIEQSNNLPVPASSDQSAADDNNLPVPASSDQSAADDNNLPVPASSDQSAGDDNNLPVSSQSQHGVLVFFSSAASYRGVARNF